MPRALYEQLGAKGRVFSVLTRLFYRRFKWNTAVTDAAGEELASLGVPRSTIRTVPNGIDFARIEQLAAEDLPALTRTSRSSSQPAGWRRRRGTRF